MNIWIVILGLFWLWINVCMVVAIRQSESLKSIVKEIRDEVREWKS